MIKTTLLTLALGAGLARAAAGDTPNGAIVKYTWPLTRGETAAGRNIGPCGNISISDSPVEYPIRGGMVNLELFKDMEDLQFLYAPTADSGDLANFKAWLPNLSFAYIGTSCNQAPAFEDLGFAVGDRVTLSTVSHGGPQDATFYNCADIRLVSADNFTTTANTTCTNTVTTRKTSSTHSDDADEQAEIDAAAAAAEAKKLTAAEGGGIGAGVTLGVVAMVLGAAAYLGYVSFGKKKSKKATRTFDDDKSSMASLQKAPATA